MLKVLNLRQKERDALTPAYLDEMLKNMCLNLQRSARRRSGVLTQMALESAGDDAIWAQTDAEDDCLPHDIAIVIDRMPPRTREVFLARWGEGFDHATIAADLGITTHATQHHMSRAYATLRGAFGSHSATTPASRSSTPSTRGGGPASRC